MRKKSANKEAGPEKVLRTFCKFCAEWEEGRSLQQMEFSGEHGRLLLNTFMVFFRKLPSIDFVLGRVARGKIKARMRRVLRWGILNYLYMDSLPPEVIVDVCVWRLPNGVFIRVKEVLPMRFCAT